MPGRIIVHLEPSFGQETHQFCTFDLISCKARRTRGYRLDPLPFFDRFNVLGRIVLSRCKLLPVALLSLYVGGPTTPLLTFIQITPCGEFGIKRPVDPSALGFSAAI